MADMKSHPGFMPIFSGAGKKEAPPETKKAGEEGSLEKTEDVNDSTGGEGVRA